MRLLTFWLHERESFSLFRNFLHFVEHEDSLPSSQEPAICPYPEPDQISPLPPIRIKIHFNIIFQYNPRSSSFSLSLTLPTKTPQAPLCISIRATCPVHLILLYSIARIMFGAEQKSWSSSLRSFLQSPVTSSLRTKYAVIQRNMQSQISSCSYACVSVAADLLRAFRRIVI
jgi:hypothetical protein